MGEGSGKDLLPEPMRLKGEENYTSWKNSIENVAEANGLRRYIHEKGVPPEEVDEFDNKVDMEKLKLWMEWEAGDSQMMLIIQQNIKRTPTQLIVRCKTAREMWVTLQSFYEGSGVVSTCNAIEAYTKIKYEDFDNLELFVIGFKSTIERLSNLEMAPPEEWHPLIFIMALTDAWPNWAERQRSNLQNPTTKLTLSALIEDITNEARIKDKKVDGGSAHYGGKPQSKYNSKKGKKYSDKD